MGPARYADARWSTEDLSQEHYQARYADQRTQRKQAQNKDRLDRATLLPEARGGMDVVIRIGGDNMSLHPAMEPLADSRRTRLRRTHFPDLEVRCGHIKEQCDDFRKH
jgi:hypothetical protein